MSGTMRADEPTPMQTIACSSRAMFEGRETETEMSKSYMPARASEQVEWAENFAANVGANAARYGISVGQMEAFNVANTALQDAWEVSQNAATRTRGSVVARDNALKAMRAEARRLVSIIRGTPGVTDQMLVDAGITVPKQTRTPIPVPTSAPTVAVLGARGRTVNIRITDPSRVRRGKPTGTGVAAVLTYVGEIPPVDPSAWTLAFVTTRTTTEVQFDFDLPAGSGVWVAAAWQNPRMERGPLSDPAYYNFGGDVAVNTEGSTAANTAGTDTSDLKIAA